MAPVVTTEIDTNPTEISVVTPAVYEAVCARLVVVNDLGCRKVASGSDRVRVGCALVVVKQALWEHVNGPVPRGHVLRRECPTLSCVEPSCHVLVSRKAWGQALGKRAGWLTGQA